MREDRCFLFVLYFLIPLLVVATFLPLLDYEQRMATNRKGVVVLPKVAQRTVGLMTPNAWPDAVASDYDDVKAALDSIPTKATILT
jgi:hypothetical protein